MGSSFSVYLLKDLLVDPIYEINPLTALVDLITKIILHPLTK